MEKEKIELYTDYLICNQGFATATGLSAKAVRIDQIPAPLNCPLFLTMLII
ncbi:hypothetical protein [Methylovulum psychrotolerans]|uniref:hypothetical protein n=1 Tax=Methylovulum psychrotolerans TaxID=1704499 RepID=UPI0012FA956A|nr:hypothetical protein [Methylovulum psychrotolerans]